MAGISSQELACAEKNGSLQFSFQFYCHASHGIFHAKIWVERLSCEGHFSDHRTEPQVPTSDSKQLGQRSYSYLQIEDSLNLYELLDARREEEGGPDDGGDGELDAQQAVHLPHEPFKMTKRRLTI